MIRIGFSQIQREIRLGRIVVAEYDDSSGKKARGVVRKIDRKNETVARFARRD